MNANSHKRSLFNESGCLSQEALKAYVNSTLKEDELRLVKAHISSCPLCEDAVEGVRLLGEGSVAMDNIAENLNRKLRQ